MATKNSLAKFRLESGLWSEFKAKCETAGKPYSQVLREFCLTYVSASQGLEMFTEVEESGQMGLRLDGNNSTDTNLDVVVHSVGELYSGPGGIGLGAARASVVHNECRWITEPKWVNDYDPDSCKTWENNVLKYEREQKGFSGSVDIHVGDVRSLNIEELAPVDGLMFGFPCNDFSLVGEQKGFDGAFGPLYSFGVKVLQKSEQPQWFIAENVGGITSSNEGTAFKVILDDLRAAGYEIVAHKFKFEEYRVPQARHRVIIIGFRDDLGIRYRVPAPLRGTVIAAQALANIPSWAKHQDLTRQSAQVVERLSHIKPGQNAWNSDLPQHLKLNVPNTQLSHIYKKLDPSLPAYTVTGSGGGGTHMYHWAENRALTNRERARLQTFPDWFEFAGSKESIRKQIGMAIPVAGAQLVVESVLKCLAGVDYKCVPPNVEIG